MPNCHRPKSPDIQIYRPQLTSILSISHRITGVFLSLGSFVIVAWLAAGAFSPSAYLNLLAFLKSWFGISILVGWSFSVFFHLCNGVRHLCWDLGYGFRLSSIYASGWVVVTLSAVLTIGCWATAIYLN
ncbi:succinate dehydrogenase, cytochrome b556 subunit [Hyphococcus luteus]|uniref:Succinate dehydrogenase cytochrome b556 subunit n=1 Tax=Hyphococcus luteus TaxID=2058213 RepID=A0A2S7KBF6_9PROT|nr:succinate dehydrogenase, cytochrome b556 subunit [Marinicaulis flavus]